MSYYDDDIPKPIRVLSFVLPLVLLGIVVYNVSLATSGSNLATMIVLLIVSIAGAVCSLLIPGIKGYKKLVFAFVVCLMSTVVSFSGVIVNVTNMKSRGSGGGTSTSTIPVKDELVDAPNGATMEKTGYDQIVEYLTLNEDTIRSLYNGRTVYVSPRAQINKENASTGAALYVQKIKNEVTTLQNSYQNSYVWNYDDWDAKDVWEQEPIKFYYYNEHGFIKAKEEYSDDTYYKVERFSYIYYGDTGVKEKEEFRWIVSPSNSSGESIFDCQLRVTHTFA